MKRTPLVLASTSVFKASLLTRLGYSFETCDPHVDESHVDGENANNRSERLALAKAESCARANAFSIGADQVIVVDDRTFDKPGTEDRAVEQLLELAGKTHQLFCSCATVAPDGRSLVSTVLFEMKMKPISEQRAREYVQQDDTLYCAGSYKVESSGISLFESMRGDDYTAIIGLPLITVQTQLESLGYFDA